MKLALITVAATALGAVLVTASNAADRTDLARTQDVAKTADRVEVIRLADVQRCGPPPGRFTCDRGQDDRTDDRPCPAAGMGPGDARPSGAGPHGPGGPRGAFMGDAGMHDADPRGMHGYPTGPGPGPLMLAARLSAIETFLGIDADQLDTWRAYTDALQSALRPPSPPKPETGDEPKDALAQSEMIARHAVSMGDRAFKLAAAVEALRNRLDPEQLERLKAAGPLLPPPMGPNFGPPPFHPASFGPMGPGGPGAGHITPP